MADPFTENDVESLGEKLEQFSQTLTPGEQAALMEILERATPEEGDVQGFGVRSVRSARTVRTVRVLVKSAFHTVR